MDLNEKVVDNLKKYIKNGFFSPEHYGRLVIVPNNYGVCKMIEELLSICIKEIIIAIQKNANKKQIKEALKKGLKRFNKMQYDTEEREFICHCFYLISDIVEVNFENELNEWLYGKILSFFFTFRYFFTPDQVNQAKMGQISRGSDSLPENVKAEKATDQPGKAN